MNLTMSRKRVDSLLKDLDAAERDFKKEKRNYKLAKRELKTIKEAQTITQQIAQLIQQQAHERIEGVVSKCLEAIFGSEYGFKIDFQRKRGKTEAILLLLREGHEIEDAMNADSGGVVEIAAFALRIACIVLSKPNIERILVMDEPFRNLDVDNRESVKTLLVEVAEDFLFQFIIVTHEVPFQIGKVIEI